MMMHVLKNGISLSKRLTKNRDEWIELSSSEKSKHLRDLLTKRNLNCWDYSKPVRNMVWCGKTKLRTLKNGCAMNCRFSVKLKTNTFHLMQKMRPTIS